MNAPDELVADTAISKGFKIVCLVIVVLLFDVILMPFHRPPSLCHVLKVTERLRSPNFFFEPFDLAIGSV